MALSDIDKIVYAADKLREYNREREQERDLAHYLERLARSLRETLKGYDFADTAGLERIAMTADHSARSEKLERGSKYLRLVRQHGQAIFEMVKDLESRCKELTVPFDQEQAQSAALTAVALDG